MTNYERIPAIQDPEVDILEAEAPPALTTTTTTTPSTHSQVKDGVFNNISAKPDIKYSQEPPSYFDMPGSSDPTPPYIEETIISTLVESGDVLIEGMPVGHFGSFITSMLISILFDFIGYLMTSMLSTSHASKFGARAGLGWTLMRIGMIVKFKSPEDEQGMNMHDRDEITNTREWISFVLIAGGAFLLLKSNADFVKMQHQRQLLLNILECHSNQPLDIHAPSLALLLDCYNLPSKDSADALNSKQFSDSLNKQYSITSPQEKDFCLKLSSHLNLCQKQCLFLLRDCIKYELQHPIISSKYGLENGIQYSDSLLDAVTVYYHSERESLLLLVEALIKSSQDPEHPFHDYSNSILDQIITPEFQNRITKQLENSIHIRVPKIFQSNPKYANIWANQYLLEQRGLLQLLIMLYYDKIQCAPEKILEIVNILSKYSFGNDQINNCFFDDNSTHVLSSICHQSLVLVIELLNFEVLHSENSLSDASNQSLLLKSPEILDQLNNIMWNILYNPTDLHPYFKNYGPLALVWGTFTQRLVCYLEQQLPQTFAQLYHKLTQSENGRYVPQVLVQYSYSQLQAISRLSNDLKGNIYLQNSSNSLAYRSVIKGFFTLFLLTQNVSTLPERKSLVDCFSLIISQNEELTIQFWEQDFPIVEKRSLLDTSRRCFPLEFDPLIELLDSLVGNADSALYVIRYFKNLNSFTDLYNEIKYNTLGQSRSSQTRVFWKGSGVVFGSKKLQLCPAQESVGYFVGKDIVLLEYSYSGFHLLLCLIDSFISQDIEMSEISNLQLVGTSETITRAFQLLATLFQHLDDVNMKSLMNHFGQLPNVPENVPEFILNLISEVLNRCTNMRFLCFNLVSNCLKCLSVLLKFYPDIVWRNLRAQNFLPKFIASAHPGTYSSSSYLQQIVLPSERSTGRYQITLMFLKLVQDLINDAQSVKKSSSGFVSERQSSWFGEKSWIMAEVLYSCILFIHSEIFSTYTSWRYESVSSRLEIGLLSIKIFNSIVKDTTWTKLTSEHLGSVREYLLYNYLDSKGGHHLNGLIDALTIGNELPLSFYRRNQVCEALTVEMTILEVLDFLKTLISIRVSTKKPISLLELVILDKSIDFSIQSVKMANGDVQIIQTIGCYTKYELNLSITKTAVDVLTMMAVIAHEHDVPTPSFVGFFSEQAQSIVDSLMHLLKDDYKSNDDALQASIYNFISVVISSQPGLARLLLSRESKKDSNALNGTILEVILSNLKNWKLLLENSAYAFSCMLKVLVVLWSNMLQHRNTVLLLRSSENLWTCLKEILVFMQNSDINSLDDLSECYWDLVKSYVMAIVALGIHSNFSPEKEPLKALDSITNIAKFALDSKNKGVKLFMDDSALPFSQSLELWLIEESKKLPFSFDIINFRVMTWDDEIARPYGNNYIYDSNLFKTKYIPGNECEEEIAFLDGLKQFNMNLSKTDAFLLKVKAWKTLMQTVVYEALNDVWPNSNPVASNGSEIVFSTISAGIETLKNEVREGYLTIAYREELTELILFLVGSFLQSKTPIPSAMIMKLVCLITPLLECMHLDLFKLGPAGYFSEFQFHINILTSIMIIIRLFNSSPSSNENNLKNREIHKLVADSVDQIFPIVSDGLSYLLQGVLSASSVINVDHISLFVTMLIELCNSLTLIHPATWVPYLARSQLIELLFLVFSKSVYIKVGSFDLGHSEQILELLLALSRAPNTAELLALHGIISCFSNNCFSESLIEGLVEPYTNSEINPTHKLWCLKISIVSNMLLHLGKSSQFVQEVFGFIRIYQKQIIRALNILVEHPLSLSGLEETLQSTQLFYALAKSDQGAHQSDVLYGYQDFALRLFSKVINLFKSPIEFQKTARAITAYEKNLMEFESVNLKTTSKPKLLNEMETSLFEICRNVSAHFRWITKADQILNHYMSAVDSGLQIFQITMQSQGIKGCSIGNIFDITRIFLDVLAKNLNGQNLQSTVFASSRSISFAIETLIALISTQFSICLCTKEIDASLVREIGNELKQIATEYKSIIRNAEMNASWDAVSIKKSNSFMDSIQSFLTELV